jgi:DNA-binding CsgD family transcriptional regulator
MYCLNRFDSSQSSGHPMPQRVLTHGLPANLIQDWQRTRHAEDPFRRMFASGAISHNQTLPLIWQNLDGQIDFADQHLSVSEIEFMRHVYACGITSGCNIPIYLDNGRLSLVSFFSSRTISELALSEGDIAELLYLGHRIHEELTRSPQWEVSTQSKGSIKISPRELECMRWASRGKNATEIAQILGISTLTVRDHFKNAAAKLNTVTRTQALARLYELGILLD